MTTLRIILGDQLSYDIASLTGYEENDFVLMMEVREETEYVKHHKKKLVFIFSAMRHFAQELIKKNYRVKYIKLDDSESLSSFTNTLNAQVKLIKPSKIVCTEPGEHRVLLMMQSWEKKFKIPVEIRGDKRYFSAITEFEQWANGRKNLRMEFFYRTLRQKTGILMQQGEPIGSKWNYDSENRHAYDHEIPLPKPYQIKIDKITQEVIDLVKQGFDDYPGEIDNFNFAVTRKEALQALDYFINHALPYFGTYQDAMMLDNNVLFHSQLSQYLNIGLLLPKEVCEAAEKAYAMKQAPLNAVEGFIRQILGWREYIRGIYWLKMPEYVHHNYLQASEKLPDFYWDGKTEMRCMQHVIGATLQDAQSHHIQRLMITGNFALLYGVLPSEVCAWYLAMYADAYEWVELPNTLGMALYGDGGFLASKPYAASGAYINKMSNFCQSCHYQVKLKVGPDACPFNYLYWDFMLKHQTLFRQHPRLKFAINHVKQMNLTQVEQIKESAKAFRKSKGKKHSAYGY